MVYRKNIDSGQVKASITIDSVLWLFLLAVLANVAYCAAYIVDIFVQASAFRSQWQQFRWLLFALGVSFVIAHSAWRHERESQLAFW